MPTTIIDTENIAITRRGTTILENISLKMTDDQHLAIIGPNGAGKSFLLQIISADLIPSSGRVTILDGTFGKISLWDLRRKIGFVSNRMLFWYDSKATVFDIVCSGIHGAYGVPEDITEEQKERASESLKAFKMESFADQKFQTVSDGERRKILLARALVNEPALLIFDEPCQGLDIPSREHFLEDINVLAQKTPIVYVTHHLEELPSCITDVAFLKEGKMFDSGKKADMLTSEKISAVFDYDLDVSEKDGRFYVQHR